MKNKFKLDDILSNKKYLKIIAIIAFVGIALIVLSDLIPESSAVVAVEDDYDYVSETELRIEEIVSAITGENSPDVMITLHAKEQYVYAKEIKTDDSESEESYIIIKNSDGAQEAVILTQLEPEVKGIVIASRYANNAVIKEDIINAISTVLDLPANKVCVVAKNK